MRTHSPLVNLTVRRFVAALVVIGWIVAFAGCANYRLPAIDPSGERIFLPSPNFTTLESCLPKPAFATPPDPPNCPPSFATAPVPGQPQSCQPQVIATAAASEPLRPGRNMLKVSPGRIVMPVGREAVLVAGYCGGDGRFVMKAPVEWTLSQESVGHFVNVAPASREYLASLMHEEPKKMSANYAITHTIQTDRVVTRGTKNPADDVTIKEGQTWISVTSPTEGTSHVTVMAPKAENWDERRQTATIHWVDAQWFMPAPAVVKAGTPHELVTTVQRATNGSPLTGWVVRYEIITGGSPARFANGQTVIETQTDAAGHAAAQLIPTTGTAGLTNVAVFIERPASASGELTRMAVGQGGTVVQWSAASLAVNVLGPDVVEVQQFATYQIQVTNNGDLTASDVIVSTSTPPNMEYVGSDPPAQFVTGQLSWQLGDLTARTVRPIQVQFRAIRGGDVQLSATAESRADSSVKASGSKDRTRVFEPALSLAIVGPQLGEVGQEVTFKYVITNRGDVPVTNVVLTSSFDPGLRHSLGELSPIRRSIPSIAPREPVEIPITFIPQQPGRLRQSLEALADGGQNGKAEAYITVTMPNRPLAGGAGLAVTPGVVARITGPQQVRPGDQPAEFSLSVTNQLNTPLRNVSLICTFDQALLESRASEGFIERLPGKFVWNTPELAPNQMFERRISFTVGSLVPRAAVKLIVTANNNVYATDAADVVIVDPNAATPQPPNEFRPPPGGASGPPVGPPTGQLQLTAQSVANRVAPGQRNEYQFTITNDKNAVDSNVVLTIRVPPSMDIRGASCDAQQQQMRLVDNQTLEIQIAALRARESVRFRFDVPMPAQPGRVTIQALARSQLSPAPVEALRETDVAAP